MIRNVNGFSLTEVLVTVAILALALYTLVTLATDLEKSPAYSEAQVSVSSIAHIIREDLKYQTTCTSSLVNSPIDPVTQEFEMKIPGILADGTPLDDVLKKDQIVQKLKITSLHFVNTVDLGANKRYSQVQLDAQIISTGLQLRPWIAGAVFYTVDATNKVVGCNSTTTDPVSLCQAMGCTWDITKTPPCQCTPIDMSCPPQKFLTKYDPTLPTSNAKTCTGLGNGACPPGTYLRGVFIGGNDCVLLSSVSAAATLVNGACGTADSTSRSTPPASSTELCSAGSVASAPSGPGPWAWTCNGANGGTNASCNANYAAPTVWTNANVTDCGIGNAHFGEACAPANSWILYNPPDTISQYCNCGNGLVGGGSTPPGTVAALGIWCDSSGTLIKRDKILPAPCW